MDPIISQPLNVAASSSSHDFASEDGITIVEQIGVDAEAPMSATTMWIRFIMLGTFDPVLGCSPSGGIAPQMSVRARPLGGGTWGDPVTPPFDNPATTDTNESILPIYRVSGSTDPVNFAGVAILDAPEVSQGVFRFRLAAITPVTTEWQIAILNNDGVAHDFIWVVANSDDGSKQPWIDITPASYHFETLINDSSQSLDIQVANKGTGPLEISDSLPMPIGSDFTLSGPGSGSSFTINPNACETLTVTYTPPSSDPGDPLPDPTLVPATLYTATSNDSPAGVTAQPFGPGHNNQITLSARSSQLEIALVLDDSGSMSWHADGTGGKSPSRWSELNSAVNQFLDMLAAFGNNKGTFGIVRFRATDSTNPSTHDIFAPTNIEGPGSMSAAQSDVSSVTPVGWTHMGDGINRVMTVGAGYFSNDPTAIANNRRWLLLMSDGASNRGKNPRDFIPPPAGNTPLQDNKITVFGVGYGIPGKKDVDHGLIQDIVNGSFDNNDDPTNADRYKTVDAPELSALNLAEAFRKAITAGLTPATSVSDPRGEIGNGINEVRHKVVITPYDTKIVFVLNWNTPDAGRLDLELQTPDCEILRPRIIDPDVRPLPAGVHYSSDSRYKMFTIEERYLRNWGSPPGDPRDGIWTLIISSDGLYYDETEHYEYDVIVESSLRMDARFDQAIYYAGDPIGVSAQLILNGKPIANATVMASTTAPGASVDNWLASIHITDEEYQKAAEELADEDVHPLFIKAYAARQKGIVFEGFTNADSIPMTYDSDQGRYQAQVSQTSVPESYTFYITATGVTEDGVVFQREKRVQTRVRVQPAPVHTLIEIQPIPSADPDLLSAIVRVIPRDRFGNVYLIDPASNPSLVLTVQDGDFTDDLATRFDGIYTRTLTYAPDANPVISLQINGQDIAKDQPVPSFGQLTFADQVLDFKPGGEGAPGANEHADPEAALGNDLDTFVSLGAYGSLSVGIKGQLIVAEGPDDVTVFIRPDEDRRAYIVEALSPDKKDQWVTLGTSAGVTQSFGLGEAGLEAALAIRITDQSGRSLDRDLQPISTPGVSIISVGIKAVEDISPHWLGEISVKELLNAKDDDVAALNKGGIETIGELAYVDVRRLDIDLNTSQRLRLRAQAILALESASEIQAVPGVMDWTVWKVSRISDHSLMEAVEASDEEIRNLIEEASGLRLSLKREFLESITIGDLTQRTRP